MITPRDGKGFLSVVVGAAALAIGLPLDAILSRLGIPSMFRAAIWIVGGIVILVIAFQDHRAEPTRYAGLGITCACFFVAWWAHGRKKGPPDQTR